MDFKGCGLWLFLGVSILILVSINPLLLLIPAGIFVIYVAYNINQSHKENNKGYKPHNQVSDVSEIPDSHYLSSDYFEKVSKVVDDLMEMYNYAVNSPEFEDVANGAFALHVNYKTLDDKSSTTAYLFWIDAALCCKGLGISYEKIDKFNYGLYYFIERTLGGKKLSYENHRDLYRYVNHVLAEETLKDFYSIRHDADEPLLFMVAHVLERVDVVRKQKYLVLLYRFASVMAKADNTVTDKESAFLRSIMQVQNDGINIQSEGMEDEDMEGVYHKFSAEQNDSMKTELDDLIGLESVKREVKELTNYIRIQKERGRKGMRVSPITYHCVFTGNPGTGKTTVARILAKIYKNIGVIPKGHLVETDRSGLVGEYVGQTAVKTNKVIDHALGGVLFIDEAYSLLGDEKDYGREAIATLLKRMEDERGQLVVILAGYTKEMQDFINSKPGLQSRFSRYIEFPDYNADELFQIFCKQLKQFEYTLTDEAAETLKGYFSYAVAYKGPNFGNARFVRNVFEHTLQKQANRLAKEPFLSTQKLAEITKEDLATEAQ